MGVECPTHRLLCKYMMKYLYRGHADISKPASHPIRNNKSWVGVSFFSRLAWYLMACIVSFLSLALCLISSSGTFGNKAAGLRKLFLDTGQLIQQLSF